MTTEGALILFVLPATLIVVSGGVLVAHRAGWISDDVLGRVRTPAKWLSYIVWSWLILSFLTGTLTIIFDWRPDARVEEVLLLGPLYWAMWFAPYIVVGVLLTALTRAAGQVETGDGEAAHHSS